MPAIESQPRKPISVYGFHKVMAEQLCHCYAQQFNVPITIVRLFSVYGPGLRKQLPWDALNRLRVGDRHFHCTGLELRDWLHVRDAARLLWQASHHERDSWHIVNSSGQRATTAQALRLLSQLAGHEDEPTFSGASQPSNPMHLIGSAAEAERTLGWRPEIALQEGLADFVAWYEKAILPS